MNNDYIEFRADSVTVKKYPHRAVRSDGITKFYTADTVYTCMEERTEDQLTAYRRLMGHEPDLVTTEEAVDINRLREKAEALEKERDQLRRELDNVHGLVRVMKADYAWREGKWAASNKTYKKQIQEQAERIDCLLQENDALHGDVDELKAQIRKLKADDAMLETVRAAAKVEYEKRIKAQAEKIDHLLQDRVELRTQLDNKDAKIDSLLRENVVLQAQLADKDNTIKLLLKQFANRAWGLAREQIDAIEPTKITMLIDEIDELKKANAELKLKHKEEMSAQADEKAQLSEAYENLIIGLKEENTCLKKTCEDLRFAVEKKTETFVSMSNSLADLKEKNRKRLARIEELEADAKALRSRTCKDGHNMRQLRLTVRDREAQIEELQGVVEKTKDQLRKSLEQRARLQGLSEKLFLENAGLRGELICFKSFRP